MVKHWRGDIRLLPPAIKKIFARKFVVMQQPGPVILVPLCERDLLNESSVAASSTASLTRRANHRHIVIVETISPRRETGRGLFESDGGRMFRTPHPPMQRIDARRVLIELPSEPSKLSMIPGSASRLS